LYHVAESQHAGKRVRRRLELTAQDVGKSAFVGFDDRARMIGDQSAQQDVGMLGVAQVPGAIELVQARKGKDGSVADAVLPRGGFQQIGVCAEDGRQTACPRGDALDVGPAAREGFLQECPGKLFGRETSVFMRPG
jgi:hypothetical protein